MTYPCRVLLVATCILSAALPASQSLTHASYAREDSLSGAFAFLDGAMDQFHTTYWVYQDVGTAGNHFHARGAIIDPEREQDVAAVHMEEDWRDACHSGASCIRCSFGPSTTGAPWAGFYFMNGVLFADDVQPRPNWGDYPAAGVDLTGATTLTFWARGEVGGERIDFFVGGVGRQAETGIAVAPYPDSVVRTPALFHEFLLTAEWQEYRILLAGRDLSYVLGGFAWVVSAEHNPAGAVFYVDDISFDKPRPDEPRFVLSYRIIPSWDDFDLVMRNVAFTYDNALVLLAELTRGTPDADRRAALIADAFVYAQANDRYYSDGRLRNAYQAGDLVLPPGWVPNGRTGTVSMPGWWDAAHSHWYEDEKQVSTDTGNMAWAILALTAYYERALGTLGPDAAHPYLDAAVRLGQWIADPAHCHDTRGAGGYTGGFQGWEPDPARVLWKSTEHNIDCYAAFRRLYALTGDSEWESRSAHAATFVQSMWDAAQGHFWTGTRDDGVTVNTDAVPVDAQAWAVLAFGSREHDAALQWVNDNCRFSIQIGPTSFSGFDFSLIPGVPCDGIWWEGTAQMADALLAAGRPGDAVAEIENLQSAQESAPGGDGLGIVAATPGPLTTGFDWLYFPRLHVGATAWFVMALNSYNPFTGEGASPVVADAGSSKVIAPGGWTTLEGSGSGGVPPYAYSWSPTAGLSDPNIDQPVASPAASTTYTLTVTDDLGQTDTDTATVTVATAVVADAGPDKTIASAGSTTLAGSALGGVAPYSYSWSPSTGLSDPNIAQPEASPSETTTYTLAVADSLAQTATDTVTVTVASGVVASAGPDKTIAGGGSTILGGSASGGVPPYHYAWYPVTGLDDPSAAQPTASPVTSTAYALTVTDSVGQTDTDTVTVTVASGVVAEAGPNKTTASGGSTVLDGSASGGLAPYSYAWSPSTGLSSTSVAQPMASLGTTTVYTLTVTDSLSQTDTDTVTVTVISLSDIPTWAQVEIMACVAAGIVVGYPNGLYHPEYSVTRDQMAVYIARALVGGEANLPDDPDGIPYFPDVPEDHWAYRYIEYCHDHSVVRGYWDGYHPDESVDRGQIAVYVARAKGWVGIDDDMTTAPELFLDVPAGFWSGTAVQACVANGVVYGYDDGYYHPGDVVTRDQMAVYVARAFALVM